MIPFRYGLFLTTQILFLQEILSWHATCYITFTT